MINRNINISMINNQKGYVIIYLTLTQSLYTKSSTKRLGVNPLNFNYDVDKEKMGSILAKFPQQCWDAISLAKGIEITVPIKNIVVAGMGGSGITGDILKNYLSTKMPVEVVKDYALPEWVNSSSLVFIVSYSGNTEETSSAYRIAMRKSAQVIAITSNGKNKRTCSKTK